CSLHPTATGATMGWVCLFVPGLARPSSIDGYLTDLAGRAFSMTQKYCNILAADLFDAGRNQLYLSAGDHIDVFSLVSNQFLTPITPPAQGASKQFAGLALSLDGSLLLATDLLDGSLGAINPDTPSNSYVIPIALSIQPIHVAPGAHSMWHPLSGTRPSSRLVVSQTLDVGPEVPSIK